MHWPRGGWGNTDAHGSGRDMKSQGEYPLIRALSLGGDQMIEDQYLVRGSLSKEFKSREQQLSQE